jgi:hypothetical protein
MPAGSLDGGEALLNQQVLRGLGDKLYDKRKLAALEVEQLVKNLAREARGPGPAPQPAPPGPPARTSPGTSLPLSCKALVRRLRARARYLRQTQAAPRERGAGPAARSASGRAARRGRATGARWCRSWTA